LKVVPRIEKFNLSYFGVFDGHSSQVVPDIVAQKLDQYFVENLELKQEITPALKSGLVFEVDFC